MAFLLSAALLIHATAFAIIAFFVLFAASKATGWLKGLGSGLGIWVLIIALLALIGAGAAPFAGGFMHARGAGPHMMQRGAMMGETPVNMRAWRARHCPPIGEFPGANETPAAPTDPQAP